MRLRLVWVILCLLGMLWLPATPAFAADSVTSIAVGSYHSCAVMNKQVWCWGTNDLGQLGDGTTTNRAGAVRVIKELDSLPLQNVTAVDASAGHSCAIVAKQVWCWGANFDGKLGDGTTTDRLRAVQVQKDGGATLDNVTAIALGYHFSCAISNKQVWCWGNNQHGEIGDGTTTSATTGAVLADYGTTALTNVTQLAAGYQHACAISGAKIYCWGANDHGQLGRGSTSASELDAVVVEGSSGILPKASSVSAGWGHTCGVFLKRVYCWGDNSTGQLGTNDTTDRTSASESFKVGVSSFKGATAVFAGSPFSCAIENKAVWCWGENTNGALATNTDTSTTVGVASQYRGGGFLTGVTTVDVGLAHACAIIKKQAWCWGENGDKQLGDGTIEDRLGAVRVTFDQSVSAVSRDLSASTLVSAGAMFTCAVSNKQLYCWGANGNGELSNGGLYSYYEARSAVTISGAALTNVTNISAGYSHGCAVANKQAYCWGENTRGKLGDGTTTNRLGAVTVLNGASAFSGVTAISAGGRVSCAVANKQAYCWGYGQYLGNGSYDDSSAPLLVRDADGNPLTNVTAISAGWEHACAISNKTVYCWGSNGNGQIGDASSDFAIRAKKVVTSTGSYLNNATTVGAGFASSCAIHNKAVYCWGSNASGQVGDGTDVDTNVALPVMSNVTTPLGVATDLGVGGYHACATVNKGVYCWGENSSGQLGDGTNTNSSYATTAQYAGGSNLANVTQIRSGTYHTCAVIAKQVYCWGSGVTGAIGDGAGVNRTGAVKALFHQVFLTVVKGL